MCYGDKILIKYNQFDNKFLGARDYCESIGNYGTEQWISSGGCNRLGEQNSLVDEEFFVIHFDSPYNQIMNTFKKCEGCYEPFKKEELDWSHEYIDSYTTSPKERKEAKSAEKLKEA